MLGGSGGHLRAAEHCRVDLQAGARVLLERQGHVPFGGGHCEGQPLRSSRQAFPGPCTGLPCVLPCRYLCVRRGVYEGGDRGSHSERVLEICAFVPRYGSGVDAQRAQFEPSWRALDSTDYTGVDAVQDRRCGLYF